MWQLYATWAYLLCTFIFIWYNFKEAMKQEKTMTIIVIIGLSINILTLSTMTLTILTVYQSPHSAFAPSSLSVFTSELLNCTIESIPELSNQFTKIEECLQDIYVYRVRNGRLPYLRRVPEAFVLNSDKKSIFVSSHFENLSESDKGLVMIHECAHIALGAKDYAYIWQDNYKHLTKEEHYNNADSFMDIVLKHCVVDSSFT